MDEGRATILIIEDDAATRTFLADNLCADGYEPLVADCARDGMRLLESKYPDLAIIDVALPDGSGLDRIRGFERGADDYVCKPFSYGELRARLAALLQRADQRRGAGRLRVGPLEVDPPSREVRLRGERIELSQKEYALLRALAAEPTRVWTKDELLRTVWGYRAIGSTRTLDSHACRLRHKLGRRGDRFVINVWGVGYRLVDGPVERGVEEVAR